MLYIDIHTHKTTPLEALFVVNERFGRPDQNNIHAESKTLYSHGLHPWDAIEETCLSKTWKEIERRCSLENVPFIGESGLDQSKNHNWQWQEVAMQNQISISENLKRPMIIHNVKASQQIIEMKKRTKAQMPWVLHDFNGNEEMIKMFLQENCYFSLGKNFLRSSSKIYQSFHLIPSDRLFFETDENTYGIDEIYNTYAKKCELKEDELKRRIIENFIQVTGSKYLPFFQEEHLL